jgi:predicted RNA polymerase sigma factor
MFWVKQEEAYSTIKEIKAGIPQGSVLRLTFTCCKPGISRRKKI